MSDTPLLGLPLIAAEQAQKHVTHNEALAILDAVVQLAVKDRDLAAPPGSPAEGDRYIVAASPSGAWVGHAGGIAAWQDGAWTFLDPLEGWLAYVADEDVVLAYSGSAWANVSTLISALQGLSLLGIGTTADATNPFSAKLNKALWTAKTAAEGGDGDLRYTLNKETAADVLSLLFQTGFSGRLEIGLIGDDNLTVKVSPDGSSWTTALTVDKTTGVLRVPAGSVSSPGLQVGDADTGLYQTSAQLHAALDGTEVWRATSAGLAIGAGFDPVEFVTIRKTGGAGRLAVQAEGGSAISSERYSTDASAPSFVAKKYRGTIASPTAIAQNDQIMSFGGQAYDGATIRVPGEVVMQVMAATPSSTDMECRATLALAPAGSVTRTEIFRFEHAAGFSLFGANVVVDPNRHFRLRSYTIATLPSASPAGQMIYCSDLGGGGGQLNSDGTNWRRVRGTGYGTLATDAAFTLTPLTSAPDFKHTGTLTANRAVTLSTTNAYSGARFRITRTGGGAFTLDVGSGPLKSLATNTWGEFVYDGSAWFLAAYGAL